MFTWSRVGITHINNVKLKEGDHMQVILNNGKEEIDFTSIVLKQMAGELTREQVQELINKARNTK
jgi:predicted DNA-binding antitoxin AbrB/MazE fold protein